MTKLRTILSLLEPLHVGPTTATGKDSFSHQQQQQQLSLKQLVPLHATFLTSFCLTTPKRNAQGNAETLIDADPAAAATTPSIPKDREAWIRSLYDHVVDLELHEIREAVDNLLLSASHSMTVAPKEDASTAVLRNSPEGENEAAELPDQQVLLQKMRKRKRKRQCEILFAIQYLLYYVVGKCTFSRNNNQSGEGEQKPKRNNYPLDCVLQGLCLVIFPFVDISIALENKSKDPSNVTTTSKRAGESAALLHVLLDDGSTVLDNESNNGVPMSARAISLLDVFLEAAFEEAGGKLPHNRNGMIETTTSTSLWLALALEWIMTTGEASEDTKGRSEASKLLSWKIRSKTLLQLHETVQQQENEANLKPVQESMSRFGQRGLLQVLPLLSRSSPDPAVSEQYSNDTEYYHDDAQNLFVMRPSDMLQPILQSMLPLLLPAFAADWWEFVWNNVILNDDDDKATYQNNNNKNNSRGKDLPKGTVSSWTVGTAVLCAMLPHIRQIKVPSSSTAVEMTRPIEQSRFWHLIHECLKQGIHLTKKRSWLKESYQKGPDKSSARGSTGLDASFSELLRRRGLYLLRLMVQLDAENGIASSPSLSVTNLGHWNRYVACFETMEMENEPHLIEQLWETVQDLASVCGATNNVEPGIITSNEIPSLSWEWMHILWARVLLSPDAPALRKVSICQFCQGKAGVLLGDGSQESFVYGTTQKGAFKDKNRKTKNQANEKGMPLHMVTNDFIVHVLLPSFDSLEQSVGTHMHYNEGRKTIKLNMADLVASFLRAFLDDMVQRKDNDKIVNFLDTFLHTDALTAIRNKTVAFAISLVAEQLSKSDAKVVVTSKVFLNNTADSVLHLFSLGYVLPSYREDIARSLATILSHLEMPLSSVDAHAVITLLKIYPFPSQKAVDVDSWIKEEPSFDSLQRWLERIQESAPSWATTVASTMASAFVDGALSAKKEDEAFGLQKGSCTGSELGVARSIVLMCALLSGSSELLWPAINKGLSISPSLEMNHWHQADKVGRALALLEFGCKLKLLSGNGNGDLVVDRKTKEMMPPPPAIEHLLSKAVNFLLLRIRELLRSSQHNLNKWNSSRSPDAKRSTAVALGIIGSLQTLNESYPSSLAVCDILDGLLTDPSKNTKPMSTVERILIVFAAVAGGGQTNKLLPLCNDVLALQYEVSGGESEQQPLRSLFQCSKWGSLDVLSKQIADKKDIGGSEFLRRLFHMASDSVEACPSEGLIFLFKTMATTIKSGALNDKPSSSHGGVKMDLIIDNLFLALEASSNAADCLYMLDEICSILFNSGTLMSEYQRLDENPDGPTPIRDAFRRLRSMASTQRPHILHIALSKICVGWLGVEGEFGLPSLPYKQDILELISYKEDAIEESSVGGLAQTFQPPTPPNHSGTHAQSMVRAFVLRFLDKLQDLNPFLPEKVKTELLHFLILRLVKDSKARDRRTMAMLGSPQYSNKIRSWQGLCILSRSVDSEIADEVCIETFETLQESLYGQVRYFVEVFCIQCSRNHPAIFGRRIENQIMQRDMSLQVVASMMVIVGNLCVGKYRGDFLLKGNVINVHSLVAGVSPWLSSTQGFSRAIAQLLAHKLIPMAIDTSIQDQENSTCDANWYLRSLYRFLDENPAMRSLRSKQQNFFEKYDVDTACKPEFILTIPVDEGGDAIPENMVDIVKKVLVEVYDEARGDNAPTWKRVKEMIELDDTDKNSCWKPAPNELNFQRKIVPLETLNLAFEEARERRLRNVAGRRKQPLIVCASLIDKVPNLGGLARTAEIFAATKLVIPDINATKMDNFTSLSVGAGDWIEIEECTEENLLRWLLQRKNEGCVIVGVEQTSSSISLLDFKFPSKPIVLLLGKEKEGIPVNFLQAVDQCVEIPQLGIIRSLNVHVSGAISIWEYTRQRILCNEVDIA
ncbi:hypothetical protein ACA910_016386 [Epithemia clementina (nom. ined.)]